jgi:hypothetical protein
MKHLLGQWKRSLPVVVMVLLTACAGATTEPAATSTISPATTLAPTPESTEDTGPGSSVEFDWPTVRAAKFIYRPSRAVFGSSVSSLTSTSCYQCASVALGDGRVLLVGNNHIAEIWDPDTGQWAPTGDPNSPADSGWGWGGSSQAVLLDDGRVLVTLTTYPQWGGEGFTQVEIYDPADGLFRLLEYPVPTDPVLSVGTVPVVMSSGRVLLANSIRGGVVFDPGDESFTSVGDAVWGGTAMLSAVALTDGRVLLVGESGAATYNPDTDEFQALWPVYPTPSGFALALLQDGRVLVTGGSVWTYPSDAEWPEDLGSDHAQVFDPITDRFTAVGSMLEPRSHHSTVTLPEGRVVIFGGDSGRVQVFDPETATFESAPSLTRPRQNPTVTLLNDGTVLIVGGRGADIHGEGTLDPTTPRTAETYHPKRRSGEPSAAGLYGITLGSSVEFNQNGAEPPMGQMSLRLVIPPSGLQGATFGMASAEFYSRDGSGGGFVPLWFYSEGVAPGSEFWGQPEDIRLLPAACQQGCEITELLFDGEKLGPSTATVRIQFHIQYEGNIPEDAELITLTVVEEG